ncbi:MAG: enoyl-CoA hydratase-related protein [Thermodesulfobacteriota bacterium]
MAYQNLIFQVEGPVAIVKINRPKALNALNPDVMAELNQVLDEVEKNDTVKVMVVTGEGDKAFVAGADIGYMSDLSPLEARRWSLQGHDLGFRLQRLPIPVIACVNGYALGGGTELAMACDFIYASENARFGQPEINLGLIPGFGGTQRLPRLVGKGIAKELCMTGGMISAQEAREIGLVNKVFPQDKLWEETLKTANLIATKGKVSLRAVKQCVDRGYDVDLRSGCYMEADGFALCVDSPDAREGMKAFLEKRKPDFKGKRV